MERVYQALYRKWRPRTFDDVVGQQHITDTLKNQVSSGRLSHAYLFTGTRGTGKTTCAKILARAVNCEHPVNGNPCNACPACLGIESGSILDVTEMDAASNNSVDNIRDLRDEAIYSPAAVKKRVYIVDEVHMLSGSAFNALLKILEEPPEHLMFILATTELHKVPATILSRCQRFSFKRIRPEDIANRLSEIAVQEQIDLTPEGSALLARLADGALRDALSLLDQCANLGGTIDRQAVLDALGLAGNLQSAHLMNAVKKRNAAEALTLLDDLYAKGKDIKAVLGELVALARDLLVQKTAPKAGSTLLTGGYDAGTLQTLSKGLSAHRLVQMLNVLQEAQGKLRLSSAPRLEAELCLIRLCDETLDDSAEGISARLTRLEEQMAKGVVAAPAQPAAPEEGDWSEAPPLSDDDAPPPVEGEAPAEKARPPAPAPDVWKKLAAAARPALHAPASVYIENPNFVKGVIEGNRLVLHVNDVSSHKVMNEPEVRQIVQQTAARLLGRELTVTVQVGMNDPKGGAGANPYGLEPGDKLNEVLAMGRQLGNMDIIY